MFCQGLRPTEPFQLRAKYQDRSGDADHDQVQSENDPDPEMHLEVEPAYEELLWR